MEQRLHNGASEVSMQHQCSCLTCTLFSCSHPLTDLMEAGVACLAASAYSHVFNISQLLVSLAAECKYHVSLALERTGLKRLKSAVGIGNQ